MRSNGLCDICMQIGSQRSHLRTMDRLAISAEEHCVGHLGSVDLAYILLEFVGYIICAQCGFFFRLASYYVKRIYWLSAFGCLQGLAFYIDVDFLYALRSISRPGQRKKKCSNSGIVSSVILFIALPSVMRHHSSLVPSHAWLTDCPRHFH